MPPIFSLTHIINGFLQPHKLDECNELFVTGGPYTTPHLTVIHPCVPSPWRSACLFIIMLALCLGFILVEQYARIEFGNVKLFLGAVTVGNVFGPLSLVLLLSELNLWRNIQILRLGYQIAGGGLLSIAFALCMYLFSTAESPLMSALVTGTVEELAKVATCVVLAGSVLRNGLILNGMLIGAAVGAGFSLIESMGYTFEALLGPVPDSGEVLSYENALSTMGVRALFSLTAGHVMWGAITGGALWGCYRKRKLFSALRRPMFLVILLFCILLHSGWNICCYYGVGMPCLPGVMVLTWGALAIVVHRGIRQIRSLQQLWFDTYSEAAEIFSIQLPDGRWSPPITAAHVQDLVESGRVSKDDSCRVGDGTIPVPVWHLSFIPVEKETICSWWRVPRCRWYMACFVLGCVQLLSLVAAVLRPDEASAVLVFALAMSGSLVLNFCWLIRLWRWALRRFPQTSEEAEACAFSPSSGASLWGRIFVPIYNFLWGYRLYVNLVRRFNAMESYQDRIPLWIPRLYWGNIVAAFTLLVTMAVLHQGEANMWHFLLLVLLYPVLAFFMARALNCMHRALRNLD